MATYFTGKNDTAAVRALVKAFNALHDSVQSATGASGNGAFHYDITSVPTGDFSDPSSSAVVTTLTTTDGYNECANEMLGIMKVHFADDYAHAVADTTNAFEAAYVDGYAVDTETQYALLNAEKTKFNAHLTQSGVHANNDSTNTVTADDATTTETAELLILDLIEQLDDHMASGPATGKVRFV